MNINEIRYKHVALMYNNAKLKISIQIFMAETSPWSLINAKLLILELKIRVNAFQGTNFYVLTFLVINYFL